MPGYGGSDYQRERSLISWADDLAALAGHLGVDRFALAGESGGGPFTLAAGHQLAGRVSVVVLIASGGPISPAEMGGMKARIRVMVWLAGHAPTLNTVQVAAMRRELVSPARRERSLHRELAGAPQAAHAALRIEYEAVADALLPGTRATVQELAITKRPWPFSLSGVKTPVHLWHGEVDRHAPIASASSLRCPSPKQRRRAQAAMHLHPGECGDRLLANYTQTDREGARRALTPSLCSAQTVAVRLGCYRNQLQRGLPLLRFIESTPIDGELAPR
jgi:pimeloyl-ACP methyl ester carboxylesterase